MNQGGVLEVFTVPVDRAVSSYRAAIAVELRLRGLEYADIAAELGFASKSGAWMAVQRCLKARAAKAVDGLRERELADLDVLQERSWPRAMRGDTKAVGACVRIIDSRCKLMGLAGGG